MTFLNRHRSRIRPPGPFSPSSLFFSGIPGAWYDPTDLSTMFQDNTGLTPVTAVEQPVGLIFDKSQGTPAARYNALARTEDTGNAVWQTGSTAGAITKGSVVTTDPTGATSTVSTVAFPAVGAGTFAIVYQTLGATYLNTTVTWSVWMRVASGTATIYLNCEDTTIAPAAGNFFASPALTLTTAWQRFTLTGTRTVAPGNMGAFFGFDTRAAAGQTNGAPLTVQVWGAQLQTGSTATTYQRITSGTGGEWTPGNHASQSTAASRPTYRARYNLLTYSEEFDNAAWTKGGLNTTGTPAWVDVTTAPDGTTTADRMIETNLFAFRSIYGSAAVQAGTYTFSIYLKATGGSQRWVSLYPQVGTTAWTIFDINAGAITQTGGPNYVSSSITPAGNQWFRCSITFTCAAATVLPHAYLCLTSTNPAAPYTGDGTSGAYVWGAQLLTAADVTATGNAYQRIAAATVYDTAPVFRPYLAFDGLDDSMSTSAINFTSTDKMTVFAGLSKLSDATQATVVETNASFTTGNGAFLLGAPGDAGLPRYGTGLRGTLTAFGSVQSFAAPITNVVTQQLDIGQSTVTTEIVMRVNATVQTLVSTSPSDAGTGNFGNYAMFIGRRNNASLPFNGRIYELIVRGAASSTTEIFDTETWVNARTGGY